MNASYAGRVASRVQEYPVSPYARGCGGPWSIILAGGEGERVKPFVKRWLNRNRPKQYCNFVGTRSMLQHTLARADLLSVRERQVTVIGRSHLDDAWHQFGDRSFETVLIQPENRDTGAGVFLPLTYVRAHDPDAMVVVCPSDHFIYPEDTFVEAVAAAVKAAGELTDRLVLLGVAPDYAEPDYGWIIPGEEASRTSGRSILEVQAFIEKPTSVVAEAAMRGGGLWNTHVFAVRAETLWEMGWHCFPEMMMLFNRIATDIGSSNGAVLLDEVYKLMPAENFSSGLLERVIDRVAVVKLYGVLWSDWGKPERIAETIRRMDKSPAFPWACLDAEVQTQAS